MWNLPLGKSDTAGPNSAPSEKQSAAVEAPSAIPLHLDAARLHPMAKLDQQQLQYLDFDPTQQAPGMVPSRGWQEDLSYGVGTMYLLGLGVGGSYGFAEAARQMKETEPTRVKINSLLNSVTRRGPFLGNTAATLTLVYNAIGGLIDYTLKDYFDDTSSTLTAGALTGALYRITSGSKAILISSSLATGVAGMWCVVKRMLAPPEGFQ